MAKFFVNVVDHACVVVRQEEVVAEVENVRRAAVDGGESKKPGDEILHGARFRDSYDPITTPQALLRRTVQRNEKRSVEVFQSEW